MASEEPTTDSEPAGGTEIGPTTITLIRHGESNVTVARIIGGHRSCSGLSELGRRQSARLAARLEETNELDADVLLTSHFARAVETADVIRPALGEVEVFESWPDFGEHDPGPEIDGMTFERYVDRFGTPEWDGDPTVEIFPGGETTADFHARVAVGIDRLLSTYSGRHIVVICHAGVVDAAFRRLLGFRSTGGFALRTLNTSLTEFRAHPTDDGRPQWTVVRYNDGAHLAGLPDATERVPG